MKVEIKLTALEHAHRLQRIELNFMTACGLACGYLQFRWICYAFYPETGSSKILVTNYKTACCHHEDPMKIYSM
jgi:hypothetical protein